MSDTEDTPVIPSGEPAVTSTHSDTDLRQRHKSESAPAAETSDASSHPHPLKRQLTQNERRVAMERGQSLLSMVSKVAPMVQKVASVYDSVYPHLMLVRAKALIVWAFLEKHNIIALSPAIFGFFVCFFGGHFMVLIAAVEAYRITGYDSTIKAVKDLWRQWQHLRKEDKADNLVDDDNDGVADVKQISGQELAQRKALLFLRAVDPIIISDALVAINSGFLAVLAVLRVKFAQAIALGVALGDVFSAFLLRHGEPVLESIIPEAYHKWIPPVLQYFGRGVGVSIAWTIERLINMVHAAIRGGQLLTRGTIVYLEKQGYIDDIDEGSPLFVGVGLVLASLGIYLQLGSGLSLPFPLNVVLFPFTAVEGVLSMHLNDLLPEPSAMGAASA